MINGETPGLYRMIYAACPPKPAIESSEHSGQDAQLERRTGVLETVEYFMASTNGASHTSTIDPTSCVAYDS